jgi:hypothetical protein
MAIENNCGVWSVDGVDGPHICEDVVPNTSFLNMKNVCLKIGKSLENDVLQLVIIEVQAVFWKPHHWNSICWDFFPMNDDLLVDFENLQMLQCIVYRSEKAIRNFLFQSFMLKKGLI